MTADMLALIVPIWYNGTMEKTSNYQLARLEAKLDVLGDELHDLVNEVREHNTSRLKHLGAVFGASGPLLVALIELLKLLL